MVLGLHLAGCTTPDTLQQDTTNTIVVIENMQGAAGGPTGAATDDLLSDICSNDSFTEGTCIVAPDFGVVEISVTLKNQDQVTTSFFNDVTFRTYRVTFVRADGRNAPGVDVPFPFDGAANFTVKIDAGTTTRAFILVRDQAKLEAPLRNLAFNGGSVVLSVIAEIEFFGTDGAGREISAKSFLNIHFADFANESSN
jgi:hypothetical protein